jgi:ribosomal protein L37AE/L43A
MENNENELASIPAFNKELRKIKEIMDKKNYRLKPCSVCGEKYYVPNPPSNWVCTNCSKEEK